MNDVCQLCAVRHACRGFPLSGAKSKVLPDLVQFIDDNREAMLCLRDQAVKFSISEMDNFGALRGQGADDDFE